MTETIDLAGSCRDLGILEATLDEGIARRAAIGLLVLATDQTMEHEFARLARLPGVGLYVARLHNDAEITPATLCAMAPRIAPATALLLPGLGLDVVAFGCTSAAMTLGEDRVFAEIRKVHPEVACTSPVTAAFAAFKALRAQRIGVLTPYAPSVNATVRAYFEAGGANIAAFATFNRPDDREAARIDAKSIRAGIAALAAAAPLDCVFVACTSLRLTGIVTEIEAETGIAVTSSDHALAWHCLRLAGVTEPLAAAGRLFRL
ncbi:MAG TPA: Asp/Glu racemase [Acetobacteraceae bacterium]|nr:Asp/Glu racemase [Acetobacteraceae bacterium]